MLPPDQFCICAQCVCMVCRSVSVIRHCFRNTKLGDATIHIIRPSRPYHLTPNNQLSEYIENLSYILYSSWSIWVLELLHTFEYYHEEMRSADQIFVTAVTAPNSHDTHPNATNCFLFWFVYTDYQHIATEKD